MYLLTAPEAESWRGEVGRWYKEPAGDAQQFPQADLPGVMEITIAQPQNLHVA